MNQKPIVGKVELISIPDADITYLSAKVDTGAYRSAIWASKVHEKNGVLYFTLLGPESEHYTGKELSTAEYTTVTVENSFGQRQERFSIFMNVVIAGETIRSNFTLANRAAKTYPALIGRKLLNSRFIVDVSKGQVMNNDDETQGDNTLA